MDEIEAMAAIEPEPPDAERTLEECEALIERGKTAFIEVGNALLEIQRRRLYKAAGFSTFEAYAQERWGFGRARLYQLAGAARVVA